MQQIISFSGVFIIFTGICPLHFKMRLGQIIILELEFIIAAEYTQTTLNLGKAASERSPRNAHLVHDEGERVQPTQHKFKVGRVYLFSTM